ncbi:hypothetical protein PENSPDRAFT_592553, partial [Peniophora sp. CONT]
MIAVPALLCPDRITVVTEPTIALQDDMADGLRALGIKTLVINAANRQKFEREGRDIFKEARRLLYQVVIVSPEFLKTDDYRTIIKDQMFRKHWYHVAFDESHLTDEWAEDFRPDFGDLGDLRLLAPPHVTYVALSGTLEPRRTPVILDRLGFSKSGLGYDLERRDCERSNVDIIVRPMKYAHSGYQLGDLDFLVPEEATRVQDIEKTVVFTVTIEEGHRVA